MDEDELDQDLVVAQVIISDADPDNYKDGSISGHRYGFRISTCPFINEIISAKIIKLQYFFLVFVVV